MVPGHRQDHPAAFDEAAERCSEVLEGLRDLVCGRLVREKVARDEQHVDPVLVAQLGHPLDPHTEVAGAVLSIEPIV